MIRDSKVQHGAPHRIEIFVDRIEQLFNSMDPSPFHEKDLDHDAEEFIVSWAQEYHLREPLILRIHVSDYPAEADSARVVERQCTLIFPTGPNSAGSN